MTIVIEGPPIDEFNFDEACQIKLYTHIHIYTG